MWVQYNVKREQEKVSSRDEEQLIDGDGHTL